MSSLIAMKGLHVEVTARPDLLKTTFLTEDGAFRHLRNAPSPEAAMEELATLMQQAPNDRRGSALYALGPHIDTVKGDELIYPSRWDGIYRRENPSRVTTA